jgi:hypothetical protein
MPPKTGKKSANKGKGAPKKAAQEAAKKGPGTLSGSDGLPSPTLFVGLTWDAALTLLDDDVQTTIRRDPLPSLNDTPIHFDNEGNQWCRKATMTSLMYARTIPGICPTLAYATRASLIFTTRIISFRPLIKWRKISTVRVTGMITLITAFMQMWQLFSGPPSTVNEFIGAAKEAGRQQESAE